MARGEPIESMKSQDHLINILKNTKNSHPNFTIFLGAGASVRSGIKPAGKMIEEWREQYKKVFGKQEPLEDQSWYQEEVEYSELFELLYDQPSQRREYIESCIDGKSPSWGYIYLVNLIKEKVFNTVFTSNFDDLLNEACYLYSSNLRPVVCAHDSSIKSIRITSQRPKIIKLHGDYLFDNVKNTRKELRYLDQNMEEKFRQYAPEYGLIVVGYSGRDESIMGCLESLLADPNNYPHGIYWCVRQQDELSSQVENLLRYPCFHLVQITGFDEFFADIHAGLEIKLQDELSDPFEALKDRLNNFTSSSAIPLENPHPVINKDIQALSSKLGGEAEDMDDSAKAISANTVAVRNRKLIPLMLIANAEFRKGNISKSQSLIEDFLKASYSAEAINLAFETFSIVWNANFAEFVLEKLKENIARTLQQDRSFAINAPLELVRAQQYEYAIRVSDVIYEEIKRSGIVDASDSTYHYFLINYCQAYCFKGASLPSDLKDEVTVLISHNTSPMTRIGALIVLDLGGDAYNDLLAMVERGDISRREVYEFLGWPIAKLLPESNLINLIDNHADIVGDVNEVHNYAVKYLSLQKYRVAEKILDFAYEKRKDRLNMDYYWINKAQAILYQGKELSDDIEQHVSRILDVSKDNTVKLGCYIVLGRYPEAKKILDDLPDERIRAWPIVRLMQDGIPRNDNIKVVKK